MSNTANEVLNPVKRPSMAASILAFMSVVVTLSVGGLILGTISVHACLIISTVVRRQRI